MNRDKDIHQRWKEREVLAMNRTLPDLDAYVRDMRAYYGIDGTTWIGLGSRARIALSVQYDKRGKS